ncbi:MAG: hypothetical protein SWX82_08615 [Cyanobacteriota bacterium]|nr:hypothetical protein [Cyanobacteriota bacterium]
MTIRRTIEVRVIGYKTDIESFIAAMHELKREGYKLVKQPTYKTSRKDPEDTIAYTEWLIEK